MTDLLSGVAQKVGGNAAGLEKQTQQSQQNGGRSFENVLQQNDGQGNAVNTAQTPQVSRVADPKLESLRVDLINRYQNLPDGAPKVTAIFPEYLDTKTRMSAFNKMLDDAVSGSGGSSQLTDVKGRFSQVENEWLNLDNIMHSNKELSQTELLGLQARLYQVSQHIDVLSKVIDQMSSGVKSILNTNV